MEITREATAFFIYQNTFPFPNQSRCLHYKNEQMIKSGLKKRLHICFLGGKKLGEGLR